MEDLLSAFHSKHNPTSLGLLVVQQNVERNMKNWLIGNQ
jgi:hypothetical protein